MKKNTIKIALFIALLSLGYNINAQNKELKIGTNPTIKQPSAVLEVESANKGMLMPRVELDDVLDVTTILAPANALTVFNTATAGTAPNDVTPGYYYWSTAESKWIRLLNQKDAVEPWQVEGTTNKATDNTQNIYQMGNVGIGTATPEGRLHVYANSLATTPIIEKATTNVPATNFGLGIVSVRHLANLTDANLAGYTGHGSWVAGGVTLGQNYSFKSGTDAQIDIAGISAGLIDYNNKKGQLNFFVNSGISGFKSAPLSGLNPPEMVLSTDGYLGLGTATANNFATYLPPTNKLHVKTTGTVNPVRFENLQASITPSTDKIVVADATGVLKTVPMLSMNNIYNANGTLTTQRTVTMQDKQLAFVGDHQETTMSVYSGLLQEGRASSPFDGRGSIAVYGADKNENGTRTALALQSLADGEVFISAYEEATELTIGTNITQIAAPITFQTSAGGGVGGTEKMRITGEGNIGIAEISPTERLDIGTGNVRVRDIVATIGAASDRIVVADATGVLKTVTAADITAPETNTTLSIAAGELVYANEQANNVNVNLISADADNALIAGTDGRLFTPVTENIYTANGLLTSARTLGINNHQLTFNGTEQRTYWSADGSMNQSGSGGRASLSMYGGNDSNLFIQQFQNSNAQITTGGNSTGLYLGTANTNVSAPIIFSTSAGGGANGIEKMRITGEGNIGIDQNIPTERLDIGTGNVRVRGINANAGAGGDRIVVADANGILKTIAAPTTTAIRTESANYAAVAADETILVNAAGGTVTVTLPSVPTVGKKYNVKKVDSTPNTVTVNGNGHNIDGTATISGTLPYQGWVMQYDGSNWFIISRI
jgi:hypothetical protein